MTTPRTTSMDVMRLTGGADDAGTGGAKLARSSTTGRLAVLMGPPCLPGVGSTMVVTGRGRKHDVAHAYEISTIRRAVLRSLVPRPATPGQDERRPETSGTAR